MKRNEGINAIVDRQAIQIIATKRALVHKGQTSRRPLSKDYEFVGLSGEIAFSKATGYPLDLRIKPGGDHGVDFKTCLGTVDVKTLRKPWYLLVEEEKVNADIYVLAQYEDDLRAARLLGWEYGSVMKRQPTRDFGYGVINHYKETKTLRTIWELLNMLKGTEGGAQWRTEE